MTTNYYYQPANASKGEASQHIGMSAVGWCFALRVYPKQAINSLADWEALWGAAGSVIEDEYGHSFTAEQMKAIVTSGSARPAPDQPGLRRVRLDGKRCVGHGDGPWDLIAIEFS